MHKSGNKGEVKEVFNRRRYLRMPIAGVARVTPKNTQNTTRFFIRDISIGGMGCNSIHPYKEGDDLQVKIELTAPSMEVIKGSINGKIRWSTKVDEGINNAFGFEFHEMECQQPRMYAHLKKLEEMFLPS
ncbi:MAG: PilZ domain-containing protein [Waddliaceae bacterium]